MCSTREKVCSIRIRLCRSWYVGRGSGCVVLVLEKQYTDLGVLYIDQGVMNSGQIVWYVYQGVKHSGQGVQDKGQGVK